MARGPERIPLGDLSAKSSGTSQEQDENAIENILGHLSEMTLWNGSDVRPSVC